MDAFHSHDYSKQSQNLSQTSVNQLFTYANQDQLLDEVSEEYGNLLNTDSEIEELVNLYKIASSAEYGFVRDNKGETVQVSELQKLTEIVDRHLGGKQQ